MLIGFQTQGGRPERGVVDIADPHSMVVERELAELVARVGDLRPAFELILEDFKKSSAALWGSRGAEVRGWQEESSAYLRWKRKHYPGREMLVRTGRLRTAATGASAELQVLLQPLFVAAKITTPYAAYVAMFRQIAPLESARRQRWMRILNDYVMRAAGEVQAEAAAA